MIIRLLFCLFLSTGFPFFFGKPVPKDGDYELTVLTTTDTHGRGLESVSACVKSVRASKPDGSVVLLDAGDNLTGSDASFYYNNVDTLSEHIFGKFAGYAGYDVLVPSSSDLKVRKIVREHLLSSLKKSGVKVLSSSACILTKNGLRVAVLGYSDPEAGFMLHQIQEDVNKIRRRGNPQIVIVTIHSGVGRGDCSDPKQQGLNLYGSLKGVDFVVCGQDHGDKVLQNDSICLLNAGKYGRSVAMGTARLKVKGGETVSKSLSASILKTSSFVSDSSMQNLFADELNAVESFKTAKLGGLRDSLFSKDAYKGSSEYMNLYHSLALSYPEVQISLSAPLEVNGVVPSGDISYEDLNSIYPFANELVVVRMTGGQVISFLESSYDNWIRTPSAEDGSVLKLKQMTDYRTGEVKVNFANSPGNFDSAAGLNYTVDVSKPFGKRIKILSMADGAPFSLFTVYNVAMTSYRAVGAGGLLDAAGLNPEKLNELIVARHPAFREILYYFVTKHIILDSALLNDPARLGFWRFIPSPEAKDAIDCDLSRIFSASAR
ncbi:MAG: 5'-nucleotidase C-terminal domain-containing protein [Bacteroidales bacterium]